MTHLQEVCGHAGRAVAVVKSQRGAECGRWDPNQHGLRHDQAPRMLPRTRTPYMRRRKFYETRLRAFIPPTNTHTKKIHKSIHISPICKQIYKHTPLIHLHSRVHVHTRVFLRKIYTIKSKTNQAKKK